MTMWFKIIILIVCFGGFTLLVSPERYLVRLVNELDVINNYGKLGKQLSYKNKNGKLISKGSTLQFRVLGLIVVIATLLLFVFV